MDLPNITVIFFYESYKNAALLFFYYFTAHTDNSWQKSNTDRLVVFFQSLDQHSDNNSCQITED